MAGRIAVVDADNRFLRWEQRRAIHEERLVHRSAHVLVFDAQGRLVITRRHPDKQTYPLFWENTSGHVEESDYPGEPDEDLEAVYAATAARELEEELGVSAPVTLLAAFSPTPGLHYEQQRLFIARADGPFTYQAEEVCDLRRVTAEELAELRADPDTGLTPILGFFVDWLTEHHGWPEPREG